ncbi:MAG TPA: quinol:electron acceptor oxidoreductase subunit ActD [Anaerolineales bacterium]|nr:quinol:electron acceptor oxidoreductase subunit ActD [Anaerolineales bacterium]
MADTTTLLALFKDVDPAADAIERLRKLGIPDDQMDVISGVPVLERVLGRPKRHTRVPRLALGGAGVGFLFGLFLAYGTPFLFTVHTGGQPVYPVPPGIILVFEMSMLGLMGTAFLGVFLESYFPIYHKLEYVPEVSDGKIAVLFKCPSQDENKFIAAMQAQGAESVGPAIARQL